MDKIRNWVARHRRVSAALFALTFILATGAPKRWTWPN